MPVVLYGLATIDAWQFLAISIPACGVHALRDALA
jgi:hypothetical protein